MDMINPFKGKLLRYLIGANTFDEGSDDYVTELPYDCDHPLKKGISIAYGNLFDETNSGEYAPYVAEADQVAKDYNEGQIDANGRGWEKNLREQFERRHAHGFKYIELDNADSYDIKHVLSAIALASLYHLKVIAKNPGNLGEAGVAYLAHPNVYGMIVEKDAGGPLFMDSLRKKAGKPNMSVWFVNYGNGNSYAHHTINTIKENKLADMTVSFSPRGEYASVIRIV